MPHLYWEWSWSWVTSCQSVLSCSSSCYTFGWAAGIRVMNLPASALIFCCEQPIYSIDKSHFYAKQHAGQEKTLRILGFRRPVGFGSLQSLSSLPYCVAPHSGTPQHIRSRCISAKEREKIQHPSLFLLWCCRRCREEKCDPRGSLQTVRREYMVKVKISLRMLYLKEFQIQSSFDASGFKLSFGSRRCRWCCLQAEDSPVQPVQRTSGSREGTSMSSQVLVSKHSHFFHRNVRIDDSLLMAEALCQ